MGRFFTRERFGRPQITAIFLLLAFLAQCGWLISRRINRIPAGEITRIAIGRTQWMGKGVAVRSTPLAGEPAGPDIDHSPLWYLISAAPNALFRLLHLDTFRFWTPLAVLPFLIFGVMLGGSLWYVARRLYGNNGGYIALALYCFSPAIIRSSSLWFAEPETGAAWGAFGAIFTAIAVSHTLYAPREVILWNWRRILLLALSFALAVGSQFSLVIVLPVALIFMLYLAPARRIAGAVIWAAAAGIASLLILASYFFHLHLFATALREASWLPVLWKAYAMPGAYQRAFLNIAEGCPAMTIAVPLAVAIYIAWRRTRYFGNSAPLIIGGLFLALSVGAPHNSGAPFPLVAIPFLIVFVSGICADLLESKHRAAALACIAGIVVANALWNVWALFQTR